MVFQQDNSIHQPIDLQKLVLRRRSNTNNHECRKTTNNTKEPSQPLSLFSRNRNIHSPHPRDKMTGHKDSRQKSNFTQTRVDRQTQPEISSTQLSQTIRLRPPDDLINMSKRRQRRNKMILDITEVEEEVSVWKNWMFIR